MQVNVINTNGIVKELEAQRNQALSRCAQMAGLLAERDAALDAANQRINQLEDAAKEKDQKAANDQERDAA